MTTDRPPFKSPEELAEATAAMLAQAAANYACHVFNEKEFGRLAGLEELVQVEQDRILNELVVAYLILVTFVLRAPDLRVDDEMRRYFADLKERIPKAHVEYLRSLGVKAEYLRDWETLIAMRYDEYARDRHDVRAAAMQLESSERPLDTEALSKIQLLVPVQTIAIGCHHHICRGNTDGREDLFRSTLASLSKFYLEMRVRFEGGKITPLTRARVALKRVFRRKRKRKRKKR